VATKVGECIVDIVVDAASGNLSVRQLIVAIGDLQASALGGMVGISKIAGALGTLAEHSMATAASLSDLSGVTEVSPEKLQRWGLAFESMRIPSAALGQGIRGVQKAMADVGKGKVPGVFFDLGISPLDKYTGKQKDFFKLLNEMANNKTFWKAYGLGPGQRREWLAQLGMTEDMLRVMKEMKAGKFEGRLGEQLGLTPEEIIRFENAETTMRKIQQMASRIGLDFVGGAGGLADWLNDALAVMGWIDEKILESRKENEKRDKNVGDLSTRIENVLTDKSLGQNIKEFAKGAFAGDPATYLVPLLDKIMLKGLTIHLNMTTDAGVTKRYSTTLTEEDMLRGHAEIIHNLPREKSLP